MEIKTLIELFDSVQIENAVAGLRFKPEKIIFVGFKETMTKKKTKALDEFFKSRSESIQVEYEVVGRYDFDAIVDKLNFILDRNEDCCFDVTGGKELVLVAMGAVSAMRNVPMLQINVRTGALSRVKNCESVPDTEKSFLNLEDSVKLNGCAVTHVEKDDYQWVLDEDFKADIENMWEICKEDCRGWNYQSTVFDGFEKFGRQGFHCSITVDIEHMKRIKQDYSVRKDILDALMGKGLILDFTKDEHQISLRYKNDQVRRCITKAGNILELYLYMLLCEIRAEEPGHFDDLDVGVYIDWDGVVHSDPDKEKDVKNEVDILLMRDLVPIFISCKNGEVYKEALYELSVVSRAFGGRYARSYLLATYISTDREKAEYIRNRAKAMDIILIDGLEKKTRQEIKNLLKNDIK